MVRKCSPLHGFPLFHFPISQSLILSPLLTSPLFPISSDAVENSLLLHVVELLFAEAGPSVLSDTRNVLMLLKALIAAKQAETQQLCLSLLDVLLSGVVPIARSQWHLLDELVPSLSALGQG